MTDLALMNRTTPQTRCSSTTTGMVSGPMQCALKRGHPGEHISTTDVTWPRSI